MIHNPHRRAVAITAAALLGALAAWLIWLAVPSEGPAALDSVPRAAGPQSTSGDAESEDSPGPDARVRAKPASLSAANRAARLSVPPTRVSITSVGVSVPVRPLGVDDQGLMALPETAYAAAWYRFGPGPLDGRGATVIAGHVDTDAEGTGPLARLAGVRTGDTLVVDVAGRSVRYRVLSVERVAKSVLDLPALFARTGPPRLHLVTCGGAYDPARGGYQDNVVVTARPA